MSVMETDSSALNAAWNTTNGSLEELASSSEFFLLLFALVCAITWFTYITAYNSRVAGLLLTYGLKRFTGSGAEFIIGSISLSILSGKLMFRNVVYITPDYTLRVQDGWITFRWWKPYKPKAVHEDMSREDSRMSVLINGLELHIYNRSALYSRLEGLFGLESLLIPSRKIGMWKALWRRLTIWERRNQHRLRAAGGSGGGDDKPDGAKKPGAQATPNHEMSTFTWTKWRDFFPVVKIDLVSSRFVFGNHLLPTTLSFGVEEAKCVYTSRAAQSPWDLYMHSVKGNIEGFKMMFSPSPKYTSQIDEPPRFMGEGYLVFSSNSVEAYYYWDEPGFVVTEPRDESVASQEELPLNFDCSSPPVWGLDLKCGKNTDISYGPWVERQRDIWMKFFFPWDYQQLQPTKEGFPDGPSSTHRRVRKNAGQGDVQSEGAGSASVELASPSAGTAVTGARRQPNSFDLKVSLLEQSSIDILFSKQTETQAIHMRVNAGSYLDITVPLLVDPAGYTTVINGQFLFVETTTGLSYRSLLDCETLEYTIKIHHPLEWNDHQDCTLDVTVCKGTVHLTYVHKNFIQEMIDDWSSKSRPDILNFIPYTWHASVVLKQFEVVLPVNEYNWLDCMSKEGENYELCICGDVLDLSLVLPFTDFLPVTVPVTVSFHGEILVLGMRIPPAYTSHAVLMALQKDAKIMGRDGKIANVPEDKKHRWRNVCCPENGWVDCVWVPIAGCKVDFTFHPMPPIESLRSVENYLWELGSESSPGLSVKKKNGSGDENVAESTLEREEKLLFPIRAPTKRVLWDFDMGEDPKTKRMFRPDMLPPDKIHVDLEFGASTFYLYGTLFRLLWFFKDDFLGEYQTFHDMETGWEEFLGLSEGLPTPEESPPLFRKKFGHAGADARKRSDAKPATTSASDPLELHGDFDPREYRPLLVTVSFIMHDIHGTLVSHSLSDENAPCCPVLSMEQLVVEVHKSFRETKLQVNCSPISLKVWDKNERSAGNEHLASGDALLTAFQFRGHAMFSDEERKLTDETVEYAWLVEVQLGHLMGRLTLPQIYQVVTSLNTFALLVLDSGNCLKQPPRPVECHHGVVREECADVSIISEECLPQEGLNVNSKKVKIPRAELRQITTLCPTSEDIKYRLVRLTFDSIDLVLVEEATALQLEVYPIRMATCNAHGETVRSGLSLLVENVAIHQYVAPVATKKPAKSDKSATDGRTDSPGLWLEAGAVSFGPIHLDAALSPHTSLLSGVDMKALQQGFLNKHDARTRRLWFLWINDTDQPSTSKSSEILGKCGCVGGCAFFGRNMNGKSFFKPSAADFKDGFNVAQYRVFDEPEDHCYGFGQSLLDPIRLVFEPSRIVASGDDCRDERDAELDSLDDGQHSTTSSASTISSRFGDAEMAFEYGGIDVPDPGVSVNDLKNVEEGKGNTNFSPAKWSGRGPGGPGRVSQSLETLRSAAKAEVQKVRRVTQPVYSSQTVGAGFHRQSSGGSAKHEAFAEEELESPGAASEGHHPVSSGRGPFGHTPSVSSVGSTDTFFSVREDPSQASRAPRRPPGAMGSSKSSVVGSSSGTAYDYRTASEGSFKEAFDTASERFGTDDENARPVKSKSTTEMPQSPVLNRRASRRKRDQWQSEQGVDTGRFSVRSMRTNSSASFMSANSTLFNEDDYPHPDFGDRGSVNLIDLHAQVNKPVTESPLLMSGYTSHLVQAKSKRWSCQLPSHIGGTDRVFLISSVQEGHLPPRSKYFPEFLPMSVGFTAVRLVHGNKRKKKSMATATAGVLSAAAAYQFPTVHLEEESDDETTSDTTPTHLQADRVPHVAEGSAWDTDFFAWREERDKANAKKKSRRVSRLQRPSEESETEPKSGSDIEDDNDEGSPVRRRHRSEFEAAASSQAIFDEAVKGRTTVVFKVKSPVDICFTPLAIESLQRFTDSLTDTLRHAQPMVIVDLMELLCTGDVGSRHVLLQDEKVNMWADSHSATAFQAARMMSESSKNNLKFRANSTVSAVLAVGGGVGSAVLSGSDLRRRQGESGRAVLTVMEESRRSELQALVVVPKVNITVLQTSLVEFVTSFSGLDHFQDLLCVSVLALSMDQLRFEFYQKQEDKLTLQAIPGPHGKGTDPAAMGGDKHNFPWFKPKPKVGSLDKRGYFEPLMVETVTKSREEALAVFSLNSIHTQLRRLTNECSLLGEAAISAIDPSKSKVTFSFAMDPMYQLQVSQLRRQMMRRKKNDLPRSQLEGGRDVDELMGFIMCEAGLDNIKARLVFQRREFGDEPFGLRHSKKRSKSGRQEGNAKGEEVEADRSPNPESGGHTAEARGVAQMKNTEKIASSLGSETDGTETLKPCGNNGVPDGEQRLPTGRSRKSHGRARGSEKRSTKRVASKSATRASRKARENTGGPRDSTTCAVDFESVWFNFAAPPTGGGISKKVDFSKLDWNFLSTASPAISAWQGPVDRLILVLSETILAWQLRRNSIMACLMTGAIDPVYLRMPAKSKHSLLSLISRTIQEDPGCQICTILRKYFLDMTEDEHKKLLESLDPRYLPRLDTLKKGIVALTKQLKHGLYVPMVLEQTYRHKALGKLALPSPQPARLGTSCSVGRFDDSISAFQPAVPFSPGDKSLDSLGGAEDLTDDNARLLSRELMWKRDGDGKLDTSLSAKANDEVFALKEELHAISSRVSRDTVNGTIRARPSLGSKSLDTLSITSAENTAGKGTRGSKQQENTREDPLKSPEEDLYWKFAHEQSRQDETVVASAASPNFDQSGGWNTLTSNQSTAYGSDGDELPMDNLAPGGAIGAVDVHSVFKFLLSCLGIAPQQLGADFGEKRFGGPRSVASVSCCLEQIRVHIAEAGPSNTPGSGISEPSTTRVNFALETPDDQPAFVCEALSLQVDGEKIQDSFGTFARGAKAMEGTEKVMYVSRRQLKNSISDMINVQVDVKGINQKVNLPLLRLVQHIVSMCRNAAHVQKDLREARSKSFPYPLIHQKNSSSESGLIQIHGEMDGGWARPHGVAPAQHMDPRSVPYGDTIDSAIVSAWREEVDHVDSASYGAASATSAAGRQKFTPSGSHRPWAAKEKGYEKLGDLEPCDSPRVVRIQDQRGDWIEPAPMVPECWKSLYHLINLYAITPETKTVTATKPVVETAVRSSPNQEAVTIDIEAGPAEVPLFGPAGLLSHSKSTRKPGHRRTGSRSRFLRSVHGLVDRDHVDGAKAPSNGGEKKEPVEAKESLDAAPQPTNAVVSAAGPSEKVRMHISGVININRIGLTASLSGLKLEGEIRGLCGYFSHRRAADQSPALSKRTPEGARFFSDQLASRWTPSAVGPSYVHRFFTMTSASASVKKTSIVLLEGAPPKMMTVVRLDIGRVDAGYSNKNESQGWKHSARKGLPKGPTMSSRVPNELHSSELVIESIEIDIPQHPVMLHSMMARSSKHLTQLSNTLQELRVKRTTSRLSRGTTQDDLEQSSSGTAHLYHVPEGSGVGAGGSGLGQPGQEFGGTASHSGVREPTMVPLAHRGARRAPGILQESFTVRFSISLKTLSIQASLLPSLQAQYVMDCVKSSGVTGSKAKFSIEMAKHCLSFSTKLLDPDSSLPPSASIALPRVEVWAQYVEDGSHGNPLEEAFGTGVSFCAGSYLNAEVRIGGLVHNLTTDVLNHLVFVQKVFMKEINEVLQKMTSGSNNQQAPTATKEGNPGKKRQGRNSSGQHRTSEVLEMEEETGLLYLVVVKFDGIQITATTPTSSAVRLQTGLIEVQVSNRVKNSASVRLFCHAGVNINVSLGQLVGPPSASMTDADFQQFAFFRTRIVLRNAFQEELGTDSWQDMGGKDVILISLDKPRIFVLPVAVDRAIMVWLNYRNAYEYWTEQRATLKREVLLATQQFMERVPNLSSLTGQQASYLFLMLTVKDLGICLPINAITQRSAASQGATGTGLQGSSIQSGAGGRSVDMAGGSAVMISLESTSISACSYGSLVSNGAFQSLCVRFEDEFDVSNPEWKPDWDDPALMNLCVVASGTYRVCSRTTTPEAGGNPKWLLNVSWRMDGVDIHVDTDIGKQLSTLASTLTSLTEVTDEDGNGDAQVGNFDALDGTHIFATDIAGSSDLENSVNSGVSRTRDSLPQLLSVHEARLDDRERSRLSESQMAALVRKVNNLREAGVRRALIEPELQKIRELEKYMSSEVRKGWMKKLRRQSVRGPSIREPRHVPSLSPVKASKSFTSQGSSPYVEWERHFVSPVTIPGSDTSGESESSTPIRRKASSIPKISLHGSSRSPSKRSSGTEDSDAESDKLSPTGTDDVFGGEDASSKSDVGVVMEARHLDRRRIKSDRVDYDSTKPSTSAAAEAATRPHSLFPPGLRDSSRSLTSSPDGRATPVIAPGMGRSGGPPSITGGGPIPEPLIDFECDVTVLIKSGSCVLHSKEHGASSGDDGRHRSRKETGGNADMKHNLPSPGTRRKNRDHSASGMSRLRPSNLSSSAIGLSSSFLPSGSNLADANMSRAGQAGSARNTTVILVPGLDVKAHYDSKTEWEDPANRGEDEGGNEGAPVTLSAPHGQPKTGKRYTRLSTPSTESSSSSAGTPSISVRSYDNDQETASSAQLRPGRQRPSMMNTQQHSLASGGKRARLYAAVNIHSVPEEILLSPHILDFLEQALEPLPMPAAAAEEPSGNFLPSPTSQRNPSQIIDDEESEATLNPDADVSGGAVTYAVGSSFPVDVMVSFHMKPSVFRFTCEPVSKVECLLKLPSLDLIFSRKRAEDDLLHREFGDFMLGSNVAIGGLSVAGCMADFSLYIFHPYGKKTQKTQVDSSLNSGETPTSGASFQDRKDSLSVQVEFVKFNLSRSWKFNKVQSNPAETMTSRGSFSISNSSPGNDGQQFQRARRGQQEQKEPRAVVRVSTVVDIGSATFKYDMKRLAEILGFPKAWYRRSIVRRLFLGDTMARQGSASGLSSGSSAGRPPSEPRSPRDFEIIDETGRKTSGAKSGTNKDEGHFIFPSGRRGTAKGVSLFLPLSPEKSTPGEGVRGRPGASDGRNAAKASEGTSSAPSWETLVVFAVNFEKMSIQMNMSNVMGNVLWLTKGFLADGRLSIGSSGHKDLYIGIGLENSNLDAKGGIIGGAIDIRRIDTSLRIKKEAGSCPRHMIGVNLFAVEATIENVGTSVMMGRISSLQAVLRDQWVVSPSPSSTWTSETAKQSNVLKDERPTSVHLCGDLEWDQFQLMITQSTTTELIRMYYKLSEFFSQQLHSGRIVISSLQHDASGTRRVTTINDHLTASASPAAFGRKVSTTPVGKTANMGRTSREANARSPVEESRDESPLSQHRHWQKALTYVRNLFKLPPMSDTGPATLQPIVLGGSVQMHGSTISLACFYGLNFRSQSWALFSLKHPFIAFNTEAQDLPADASPSADIDTPGTHVVQQLTFSLGDRAVVWGASQNAGESMANVCRISRSMTFPPKCRTIHDWFHYAFATGQLDDVDRFPYAAKAAPSGKTDGKTPAGAKPKQPSRAEPEAGPTGSNAGNRTSSNGSLSTEGTKSTLSASDYYQSSEVLFALPGLQLDMKSEHMLKSAKTGAGETQAPRPVVECSFVTEFDDHIFVTVDAQGFFFLHDLICSYVQDDQSSTNTDKRESSAKPPKPQASPTESRRPTRQQSIDPIEILQKDAREFICKLWQMEPTVRFISWGGKHIEPYGVDYILQKLGFRHARITIPKWLQRGCLDPLDKLLSVFVFNLLTIHMKPPSPLQPQLQVQPPQQHQEQQQQHQQAQQRQTWKAQAELQASPKTGP